MNWLEHPYRCEHQSVIDSHIGQSAWKFLYYEKNLQRLSKDNINQVEYTLSSGSVREPHNVVHDIV